MSSQDILAEDNNESRKRVRCEDENDPYRLLEEEADCCTMSVYNLINGPLRLDPVTNTNEYAHFRTYKRSFYPGEAVMVECKPRCFLGEAYVVGTSKKEVIVAMKVDVDECVKKGKEDGIPRWRLHPRWRRFDPQHVLPLKEYHHRCFDRHRELETKMGAAMTDAQKRSIPFSDDDNDDDDIANDSASHNEMGWIKRGFFSFSVVDHSDDESSIDITSHYVSDYEVGLIKRLAVLSSEADKDDDDDESSIDITSHYVSDYEMGLIDRLAIPSSEDDNDDDESSSDITSLYVSQYEMGLIERLEILSSEDDKDDDESSSDSTSLWLDELGVPWGFNRRTRE